jgi:hypothetical protein
VPKDAATKTTWACYDALLAHILITRNSIQRNNTESGLLRLPVEIRERIWAMVLGGGLIHVYTDLMSVYTVKDTRKELLIPSVQ